MEGRVLVEARAARRVGGGRGSRRLRSRAVGAAIAVVAIGGLQACGDAAPPAEPRTISTVGTASVPAAPDVVRIDVAVVEEGETAAGALDAAAVAMKSVFDALDALDVPNEDRRTRDVSLHPIYDAVPDEDGRRTQRLVGYRAHNALEIVFRDVDAVGPALDRLTAAGSSAISGLRFEVSSAEALRDAARRAAIADARRKAELFAEEAGVDIAGVLSISEGVGGGGPAPFGGGVVRAMEAAPIAPGVDDVSASVAVVWELDD